MSVDVHTSESPDAMPPRESDVAERSATCSSAEALDAVSATDCTQWYQCESTLGSIQLGIDVDAASADVLSGMHQVLRQGTLLAEHELLVEAVELWQGLELDPVPIPLNLERAVIPDAVLAEITPRDTPALRTVRLVIPAASLPELKPREQTLAEHLNISWSTLPSTLCLSSLHLDAAEISALTPGAMVLLPESFRDIWPIALSVHAVPVQAMGEFNAAQRTVSVLQVLPPAPSPQLSAVDEQRGLLEIELSTPLALDVGKCLGFASDAPDLDLSWDQAGVRLRLDGQYLGSGHLSRVGSGYGVCVAESIAVEQGGWCGSD